VTIECQSRAKRTAVPGQRLPGAAAASLTAWQPQQLKQNTTNWLQVKCCRKQCFALECASAKTPCIIHTPGRLHNEFPCTWLQPFVFAFIRCVQICCEGLTLSRLNPTKSFLAVACGGYHLISAHCQICAASL
jgi:hypothetical protein